MTQASTAGRDFAADLSDVRHTEAHALYRRVSWRIMPFLCLGFLAAYIDRVNVGFAKLQMLSDLRFGDAAFGMGAGLFFIGYILCEVPSNILMDRVGARVWLARIMLTWGLVAGAMCLVNGPVSFYILRFALGIAEAGFMPGALLLLSQWFPAARRGKATAIFMIGIPLSSVIGAPLSGAILTHLSGLLGVSGWRWLFAIEALPPLMLGIWAICFLPDRIENARWLSAEERSYLAAEITMEHGDHSVARIRAAFVDPRVWLIGFIDGTILLGLYTVAFWFPSLIRGSGISNLMLVGIITTIPHIAAVISMALNGWHSDRAGERRLHIVIPLCVGGICFALSAIPGLGLVGVVVLISFANALVLGALPPFWCIPANFLRGPAAAVGLAVACSFANFAGFFATSLIGWAMQYMHSASLVLVLFACLMSLSGFLLFCIPRDIVNGARLKR